MGRLGTLIADAVRSRRHTHRTTGHEDSSLATTSPKQIFSPFNDGTSASATLEQKRQSKKDKKASKSPKHHNVPLLGGLSLANFPPPATVAQDDLHCLQHRVAILATQTQGLLQPLGRKTPHSTDPLRRATRLPDERGDRDLKERLRQVEGELFHLKCQMNADWATGVKSDSPPTYSRHQ